ncbi:single-stranded DNA-binding protein [Cryobacterium gelidum]|uniref:Single-stranded DNA-binding protein n=1 Tax=Cryobacterium gelidum TaxID=1259164 RepID=A0A4V3IUP0_9MICO|nr:single-stranded DNA-binding protein [Cryobacterium gelidum]TFD73476.1 single-stranded DNA-binding protein [Cryobacterium gelidum]
MSDQITVSGIIGTVPRRTVANNGAPITSFRLASRQRRFDRAKNNWVDDDTSWYSITTFRQLALNAAQSLHKGEHVIVTGRLLIRNWTNAERSGIDVEIVAVSVGHDLSWYTTTPVRSVAPARADTERPEPEPVDWIESVESTIAHEAESVRPDRSGDGFVPVETDADRDAYASLDS